eukprot:1797874-Pleurochrysis_carterae.AAC.1
MLAATPHNSVLSTAANNHPLVTEVGSGLLQSTDDSAAMNVIARLFREVQAPSLSATESDLAESSRAACDRLLKMAARVASLELQAAEQEISPAGRQVGPVDHQTARSQ